MLRRRRNFASPARRSRASRIAPPGAPPSRRIVSVHEVQPPDDPDTPLAFSMEGFTGHPPAPLLSRFWAPGWNSLQALHKFQQEVGGPLRGDMPGPADPAGAGNRRLLSADSRRLSRRSSGRWLLLPAYHIFGCEPLSLLTPGIAQLAAQAVPCPQRRRCPAARLAGGQQIDRHTGAASSYMLPLKHQAGVAARHCRAAGARGPARRPAAVLGESCRRKGRRSDDSDYPLAGHDCRGWWRP